MRKLRTALCLLVLIATIPAVIHIKGSLPPDTQPMIERKYGGWSGVLRLWVREDFPVGVDGVAAWLNRCAASFEKRHPGVYIQPEYVDASALSAEGVLPPDMVLFSPGGVDPSRLAALPPDVGARLRAGLPRDARAVPVMLGGYVWAYNAALLDAIPDSWRDAGVTVAVPPDGPDRLWSAALLALCSSKYSKGGDPRREAAGEIELGLGRETPSSTPAPTPSGGALSCRLPDGFAPDPDAWRTFINGDAAAMPVTAREVRRLEALSGMGKGPDWRLGAAGAAAFTEQVMYIGALAQPDAEKLELCRAFIALLLDDESQGALHSVGAFSVTGADSGYAAGDALRPIDQMLRQSTLIAPNPFDAYWQRDAADIVRDFWRQSAEPATILARLSKRLSQKANIDIK